MAPDQTTPGVVAGRLDAQTFERNFRDPAGLNPDEAVAEAERCLHCAPAPCTAACAAGIDVPGFIGQIGAGDSRGAALTILEQNILGGICARVCPVEVLCEGVCPVAETGRPVAIARLQRFAVDPVLAEPAHPFARKAPTGKTVAVVGAGPAGLACAHRLAMLGHEVVLYEARARAGGLNDYGIAAYKTPDGYAQAEVAWLLGIGGIRLETGRRLGRDLDLDTLRAGQDAVFLALGLAGVNALRAEGEALAHVHDAVDFIAGLRQQGASALPVGRDVVVIGGGMTALETAVQARLLGAETVTMVYRRTEAEMSVHDHERLHAASKGVRIITGAVPLRLLGEGRVEAVEFARTATGDGQPAGTFRLKADQVFKAIGQCLEEVPGGLRLEGGKIAVEGAGRTSIPGVWAGGDCATGGSDLTVIAVAEGRAAAIDIDRVLSAG